MDTPAVMDEPLVTGVSDQKIARSASRWWIVGIFGALCAMQGANWNTLTPLSAITQEVYGWDANTLSWIANTANIGQLVCTPCMQLAVDALGARMATLATTLLLLMAFVMRSLPSILGLEPVGKATLVCFVVSMVFNGLSACWLNFAGPVLSTIWFPPDRRATATAIISTMPYVGVSLGYLGPLFLHEDGFPSGCGATRAGCPGSSDLYFFYHATTIGCAALLGAELVHFPSRPPNAPSMSAAMSAAAASTAAEGEGGGLGRASAGASRVWRECSRTTARLWVIAASLALPFGVFSGWSAILSLNLRQFGIDAQTSGLLGIGMSLSGGVGGVVLGAVADRVQGQLKAAVLLFYGIATLGFVGFGLLVTGVLPSSHGLLYVTAITGGFCTSATLPLFFELALESTFGRIPEGAAAALLPLNIVIVQIVFMGLAFIPPLAASSTWMNVLVAAIIPALMVPLALVRVPYHRLRVDAAATPIGCIDRAGLI